MFTKDNIPPLVRCTYCHFAINQLYCIAGHRRLLRMTCGVPCSNSMMQNWGKWRGPLKSSPTIGVVVYQMVDCFHNCWSILLSRLESGLGLRSFFFYIIHALKIVLNIWKRKFLKIWTYFCLKFLLISLLPCCTEYKYKL